MRTNVPPDSALLGYRYIHGTLEPFEISTPDRRQHLLLIGKTGTGKSSLLGDLILQDIRAGRGVAVIDPHGQLAEYILESLPRWRTEDVVYFDPSDVEFPVGLNLLESADPMHDHLVPSHITSIFRSVWPNFWGPRLEHILKVSCASLVSLGGQTLLGVYRILVDDSFRAAVARQLKDPFLKRFWADEFNSYSKQFASEAIAPILNKIGPLLMSSLLRNIIGQPRSGFDAAYMMDNKKILIANLSRGLMGEEKSNLLGSILVGKFHLAAMARASLPESERTDFFLYIDEFHNFTTDAFARMLGEVRKYRLSLTLAFQHTGLLSEEVRDAVFGNVGSIISYRVGSKDAEFLAKEFHNDFPPRRFTELANDAICVKLMRNGDEVQPFLGFRKPWRRGVWRSTHRVKNRSRERYASRREQIERRLAQWIAPKLARIPKRQNYKRRLRG